jgi:NFACT protein RNA binding domain
LLRKQEDPSQQAKHEEKKEEAIKAETNEAEGGIIEIKLPFYADFSPYMIDAVPEGFEVETLESFNASVERYFTALGQHASKTADISNNKAAMEAAAWRKYENMKQDQENRLGKIRIEKEDFFHRAKLIERNADEVSAICNIVNTMITSGMSAIVHSVIKEGKKNGDELAGMIQKINLEKNRVSVLLADPDNMEEKAIEIDIDLKMTPFENAKEYYGRMKKANLKEKKTVEASEHALKIAKSNAIKEVKKQEKKFSVLKLPPRKQYWFEKFYWFISSENYLVLSGRDAAQNEALVKKHLRKGDLYVHVEIQGGSSTVVKNPSGGPVPPATLDEIAVATICRSKAWDFKVVVGAWWVHDHQVSKTAPSGEYIGTGSFMIRGKKNFIHITRLEMAFGLLFKVDEASIARHAEERKVRGEPVEESLEDPGPPVIKEEESQVSGESDMSKSLISNSETGQGSPPKEKEEVTVLNLNRRPLPVPQHMAKKGEKNGKNRGKEPEEPPKKAKEVEGKKDTGKGKQKGKAEPVKEEKNKKISKEKIKKIKKMQEKYADQDEEERELIMRLRGAKAMSIPENLDPFANKKAEKFTKAELIEEEEEEEEEDSGSEEEEEEDQEIKEKEGSESGGEDSKEEVKEEASGEESAQGFKDSGAEKESKTSGNEEDEGRNPETWSQEPSGKLSHLHAMPGLSRTYSAMEKNSEEPQEDDSQVLAQDFDFEEEPTQTVDNFNDLTGAPVPEGKQNAGFIIQGRL